MQTVINSFVHICCKKNFVSVGSHTVRISDRTLNIGNMPLGNDNNDSSSNILTWINFENFLPRILNFVLFELKKYLQLIYFPCHMSDGDFISRNHLLFPRIFCAIHRDKVSCLQKLSDDLWLTLLKASQTQVVAHRNKL